MGVGIFTREIDEELLARRIDLAVHSLKDIPSQIHPELTIAAVPGPLGPAGGVSHRHRKPKEEGADPSPPSRP